MPVPADSLIGGLDARRPYLYESKSSPTRQAAVLTLTTHRKRDGNRRIDFDWIAVEQRGLVAPLLHGVQSRLHQQRVPGNHFELGDLAVLVDNRMQDDVSLNARLPRQRADRPDESA